MSTPIRRIALAATVAMASMLAIVSLLALSAGARAGGEAALLPDLVTLAIGADDLTIDQDEGRTLLRLSNEVANRGPGPLEIFPSPTSTGCDGDADPANDRAASQRIYADSNASGSYERTADGPERELGFGCLRYHAAHDHWHTLDFSSYKLRRERSGRLRRSRNKVGFCVGDRRLALADPAAPAEAVYPFGTEEKSNCDENATQGLSIGWADLYAFVLPGQQIRIGDLPAARYCLISRVDPRDLIDEQNEWNNVRRVRIELDPAEPGVRKLASPCRAWPRVVG